MTAVVVVDPKILGQLSAEQVKKTLQEREVLAEAAAYYYMHEVSSQNNNFLLTFRAFDEKGKVFTFAEYRNNQLVLH